MQILGGFFDGQIGDQSSVDSGETSDLAELRKTHAQDGIEVGKDHQADGLRMLTDLRCQCQHVLEGALAGALNDGSISERIAEGNAELDDACSCFDGSENHIARGGEVGIAAGDVSDESRLRFEVKGHRSIVDCGGPIRVRVGSNAVEESSSGRFQEDSLAKLTIPLTDPS